MHPQQYVLLIAVFVLVPAQSQEACAADVRLYSSGRNRIRVAEYAPRDLTDKQLAAAVLGEEWNTEDNIRWDIAALLALLSKQVYEHDKEMLDFMFSGMGFRRWICIEQQSMAAHVIAGTDSTVVVFRGTNFTELEDWRKNVRIGFARYKPAGNHRFHRGFWDAYLLVRDEALHFIDQHPTERLWVTGHSLGGAMAVLCTIDLVTSRSREPVLVTFGQPRVADSGGAEWIDQRARGRYARFVHRDDIVPSVPPTVPWLFPYAHAGRLIAMADGKVQEADSLMTTGSVAAARRQRFGHGLQRELPPVYQSAIEPPPLTQEQFDQLLTPEVMAGTTVVAAQLPDGRMERRVVRILPSYISDHYMNAYLDAVRSFRDN